MGHYLEAPVIETPDPDITQSLIEQYAWSSLAVGLLILGFLDRVATALG